MRGHKSMTCILSVLSCRQQLQGYNLNFNSGNQNMNNFDAKVQL